MKVVLIFLFAAVLCAGCTSKAKARLQAQQAFVAGQQLAMQQQTGTNISVLGEVRHPTLEWYAGMTLAEAILAAEYSSHRDPREIVIIRRGQPFSISAKELLRGYDQPLEPGDRIEIRR